MKSSFRVSSIINRRLITIQDSRMYDIFITVFRTAVFISLHTLNEQDLREKVKIATNAVKVPRHLITIININM